MTISSMDLDWQSQFKMLDEEGRFTRATVNGFVFELIPDTLFNYDTLEKLNHLKVSAWYWNLGYRCCGRRYKDFEELGYQFSMFFHVREMIDRAYATGSLSEEAFAWILGYYNTLQNAQPRRTSLFR
jgi:hypothetical protein